MSNKSKRISTIVLGVLLGAFLSAVLCSAVWYLIGYRFPLHEFLGGMTFLYGIIGLLAGLVGGAIIGLIISGTRVGKFNSVILGLIVNGALPWAAAVMLDGSNIHPSYDEARLLNISSFGQAIVGGIVGLLMSILTTYLNHDLPDDLS